MAGGRCRRGQGQGSGCDTVRLHDRLAIVGAARELFRVAQPAVRDRAKWFCGPRSQAAVQRPVAGPAHRQHAGLGEKRLLHLRRPQERARGEIL